MTQMTSMWRHCWSLTGTKRPGAVFTLHKTLCSQNSSRHVCSGMTSLRNVTKLSQCKPTKFRSAQQVTKLSQCKPTKFRSAQQVTKLSQCKPTKFRSAQQVSKHFLNTAPSVSWPSHPSAAKNFVAALTTSYSRHFSGTVPCRSTSFLSKGSSGVLTHRQFAQHSVVPQVLCSLGVRVQCKRNYAAGVQKHVSALTVKRPSRKKMGRVAEEESEQYADVVVAYAVAEELNLSQLKKALHTQGLYQICELPVDVQDAIHVRAKYAVDEKNREIFFFRDGSAVFWSMPEVERKEALKFLHKYDDGRYSQDLILREREEMDLKYIKGPTSVVGDTLQLSEESEESHAVLEKYAFSNALAQSVKLAIWEAMLEKFVNSIEFVTEDLRDGQKIGMSRREVLRKTGELFALRHLINLSSDLLDTPDFYWDRAGLEPLYIAVYNHLEMARRTKVMNEKLSHCCELTELLSSHLNDAHHTRLEVMIIMLIMVEVVFEIAHYLERFYHAQAEAVQVAETSAAMLRTADSTS